MLPGNSRGERLWPIWWVLKLTKQRNHPYAASMDFLGQGRKGQPWWKAVLLTLIPKQQWGQVYHILLSFFINPAGLKTEKPTACSWSSIRKETAVSHYGQGPELHSATALSALPEAAGASNPIVLTMSYIKPGLFSLSSVFLFNSSVFLCIDLCSSHWCCKQTSLYFTTCTILLPSQLTSGLQCQAQTSSHTCPRAQQWLLPPSLSLGAAWGGLSSSPLSQGAWVQASSAQHKVLMQSAVNLTPEGCSHRHPAVINSQRPRGQGLR